MQNFLIAGSVAIFAMHPAQAFAEGFGVIVGARASTALNDRGEQIGLESIELEAIAEKPIGNAVLYGGIYRLIPVGQNSNIFDNETDYIAGANFTVDALNIDFSANYITFPAESAEPSVELVAAIALDKALSPELIAFYDIETNDFGGEVLLHGEKSFRLVDVSIIGRAGFVSLDQATSNRNYLGLELRASHALTGQVQVGAYVRGDIANEESFVSKIVNPEVQSYNSSGVAIGVEFVFSPDVNIKLPW